MNLYDADRDYGPTESELADLMDFLGTNANLRYYTVTIKALRGDLRGSSTMLLTRLEEFLNDARATLENYVLEKESSTNVHVHALIKCPYIHNKSRLNVPGWHLFLNIIRKSNQEDTINSWQRYVLKEKSDADQFFISNNNQFAEAN